TIFSAGTIQWAFGVDDGYNDGFCSCVHSVANPAAQKITANILDRFVAPAAAPSASLSPSSLTFASRQVGTTSAAQSVTLTNSGTAPLTIGSVAIAGTNSGDYAQTNDCPTGPATLAASATCTITVSFTPLAAGSRNANISVSDDAAGSPHSVGLSGTGTAPAVSFSPASLSFGSQLVGTTSAAQSVTLTNS